MKKLLLTIFLSVMLTACGFHLRGYEPLPVALQTLHVTTPDAYGQFTTTLERTLRSNGVRLVSSNIPQSSKASLQPSYSLKGEGYNSLEILSEKLDQQVTSIGSGGQNTIYLLSYSVQYQLLDAKGRSIQTPRTISTTRNYSVGSNQILADTYVRQDLVADMQRDVIYQLLNQLRLQFNTLHADIS